MKAVKKIFHKDNPELGVDTSGSDPEASDINTSNPETDMTLVSQNNSPVAEQVIATAIGSVPDPEFSIALVSPLEPDPESLSESAPKSPTIRRNTPSPQPIKALQGLFSKLRPRSGVSSEESGAQCFVEEPVDQSLEKVVQPDGEISQVTDTQEQSFSPGDNADYAEDSKEVMGVSTDTMEQLKTKEAGKEFLRLPYISMESEDILQNGLGAPDQENTVDKISREPLEIKMNVCATIKKNILPSILCGSSKTGPGPEQEGKIQGKIKHFVRSTLGKKKPKKNTSAKTSKTETHPSPALEDDKAGNIEDELSKTQVLKAGSDRALVRRHASKEAVRKKPHHPAQQPGKTKTRELTSKPQSVNVGDSHKNRSASVPPVGPAERNKSHSVTQSQSTRRDTRHSAQESSAGIHTTRDTSKRAIESCTEPPGKPHPSVASNRAQAKNTYKETQQDRGTQESSRATATESTTIEKPERKCPPTSSGKTQSTDTNRGQKSVSGDTTPNQSQPSRSESRKERNAGSTEVPVRKPSISDRVQSRESTKQRNSTFNAAQAHKPVKKTSKDQTNHSSRRNTITTVEKHSSAQRPATDSMVQSHAVQDKGQKLQQEHSGRVKDKDRRHSTAGKTRPAPADQDTAEAKAQGPTSKKKPASASAKNQNQHAEDLAKVVPGKPPTKTKK